MNSGRRNDRHILQSSVLRGKEEQRVTMRTSRLLLRGNQTLAESKVTCVHEMLILSHDIDEVLSK